MSRHFGFAEAWETEEFGESEGPIPVNRLDYVVLANRRYGASLGWQNYYDHILPLLGFTNFSPDEVTFAQAVASWQMQNGISPADGMIGPTTWARMQAATGLAPAAAVPAPAAGKPAWVAQLLPLLNQYRGNIPLYFLLGWIQVESGGNIKSWTKLDERGYFQLHPGESQALHLPSHERLSTDPDYSVQSGIKLVNFRAAQAKRLGFSEGNELFWRATKWRHWVPGAVDLIVADMKANAVPPSTWPIISQYVTANRKRLISLFQARFHGSWDPVAGIENVDKVIRVGKQLAADLE